MKLQKAVIMIEKSSDTKKRWEKALSGKTQNTAKQNVIICSNLKMAEKLFSEPRLEILKTIVSKHPESIKQLARLLQRDFKNVYNDVIFLSDLGLLELVEHGPQKSLMPVPKYESLELDLAA
ncbi:MAG: hypothetical protein JXA66_06750 [Oligoflexia bacterium]|nr:hypothetical protein [Oligoflexia bacterium]